MAKINDWYEFSERLRATAICMFEVLELPLTNDNHIFALALLARTISNYESAIILHKLTRVMEARILLRCCYENFLYIAGMAKHNDAFIKMMISDDTAS